MEKLLNVPHLQHRKKLNSDWSTPLKWLLLHLLAYFKYGKLTQLQRHLDECTELSFYLSIFVLQ